MLNSVEMLLVMALAVAVILLLRHRQYHEKADALARQYCKRNGWQFLDGTVSSRGVSLNRKQLHLCRSFRFDYSLNSIDRYHGTITLCGDGVQSFRVNPEHTAAIEAVRSSPDIS